MPQFVFEPNLGGNRLLYPLLQITGIEDNHVLPLFLTLLRLLPSIFPRPASWRDEHESFGQSFIFGRRFCAFFEVFVGLGLNVLIRTKLPARVSGRNPGISCLGDDLPIPSWALRVVMRGEINFFQPIAGRMNQHPQQGSKFGA